MKFMLDTNICIYIIKSKPVTVINYLKNISVSDIGISTITLSELEYGVEKSQNKQQNKIALLQFLTPLEIVPYDDLAAKAYGRIRHVLEREGQPIGALDMLIAAHALSLNSILVTNNEREFPKVPELKVENWL
jgi:tRNA(fMet)-specific endonuclease VapC